MEEHKVILVYDDNCLACRTIKKIIKWLDVRDNIDTLSYDAAEPVLRLFYPEGELPYEYSIIEFTLTTDNIGRPVSKDETLYSARKALPRIALALLRM